MVLFKIDQKDNNEVRKPNDVDLHVGKRIKELRDNEQISQKKMAELIGITFQQLQKYENGLNRVVASRLYDFSRVLQVPISAFFEGIDEEIDEQSLRMGIFNPNENYAQSSSFAEPVATIDYSSAYKKEAEKLSELYCQIGNRDSKAAKKIRNYIIKEAKKVGISMTEKNEK